MRSQNVAVELAFQDLVAVPAQHDPCGFGLEFNFGGIWSEYTVFGVCGRDHGESHGLFLQFATIFKQFSALGFVEYLVHRGNF